MLLAEARAGEEGVEGRGQLGGVRLAHRELDRVAAAELGLEVLRAAEALQPAHRDDAHLVRVRVRVTVTVRVRVRVTVRVRVRVTVRVRVRVRQLAARLGRRTSLYLPRSP